MGCDIHGWVEKKVNGKWIAILELEDRSRNYHRFAKLAGVRGFGPAPKGVPEDVSETTKYHIDLDGDDGHSHSHLTLDKAFPIFQDTDDGDSISYSEYNAFRLDSDEEDHLSNYRLVFWFDN